MPLSPVFETRLLRGSVYLAILSQSICALFLIYAAFVPSYITYENLPFRVVTPVVKVGTPVLLAVTRCSSADGVRVYSTTRELVSSTGKITAFMSTSVAARPGCETSDLAINVIPSNLTPGRYFVRGTVETSEYIFKRYVDWASQPFDVVP